MLHTCIKAFLFSLLALTGVVGIAHAQSFDTGNNPVQYIVAPETPGPFAPVNIEVQGVGTFLGNATVTWQENGQTMASGPGISSFAFTTGGIGSVTAIHLIIDSATEGTITQDFVFAPSLVDMVWEANTSVPSMYLGKALYSAGSTVKVVAFPIVAQGTSLVAASKLSYQWSNNQNPVPEASGLGKNTFTFQGSEIEGGESVSVDVYLGGTKVAHGDLAIPAVSPQVILYDNDPLQGEILDQALVGSFNLSSDEVDLKAEPYYFANESLEDGALTYNWTLNGQETSGPDSSQGLLTLRQTGSGAGAAQIGVAVQNTDNDKLVQSASTALTLAFGQTSGSAVSSFFGL
jgi:hypothetical protein